MSIPLAHAQRRRPTPTTFASNRSPRNSKKPSSNASPTAGSKGQPSR